MGIYFVQAGDDGPIKIGFTSHSTPDKRVGALKTGSFARIKLLAFVPGDRTLEKQFHKLFGEHRLYGEWFKPNKELNDFLKTTPPPPEILQSARLALSNASTKKKAEKIWFDLSVSTDTAAAKKAGFNVMTLKKNFGPSGRVYDRRMSSTVARERGAKGGRPVIVPEMSEREAKRYWYDLTMTAAEALEHMTGWERKKAYNTFGPRGLRGKSK